MLRTRNLPIKVHFERHREREVSTVILAHVRSVSLFSLHLLQLALGPRSAAQVRQATDNTQHSGKSNKAGVLAQRGVRANAEGDVSLQGPVEAHLVGFGESLGVVVRAGEADEDLVAGVDGDLAAVVVEDGGGLSLAVGAESAVDADGFEDIATELLLRSGGVFVGEAVDFGKVLGAVGGEEVVNDAGEGLALVGDHADGSGDDLGPSHFRGAKAAVEELLDNLGAEFGEGIGGFAGAAEEAAEEAAGALEGGLDGLAELLDDGMGGVAKREGLGRVHVEVDAGEDGGQGHVQLVLGEDALGVVRGLQRQREDVGGEVGVGEVTEVASDVDLVSASEAAGLLTEQLQGYVLVEGLDLLVPFLRRQGLGDGLLLLGSERRVTSQQLLVASFAEDEGGNLTPEGTEVGGLFDNALDVGVGRQVDLGWSVRGAIVRVVRFSAEVLHDVAVLAGDGHGVVGVDGVGLEVVGEGTEAELVEDAALIDAEVVAGLRVTPVGQVSRVLVDGVEPVTTNKGHGIGQDRTRDGVGRGNADTRNHGLLGLFGDDTGVELDKVGVLIQMTKRVGNIGVAVDLLERLVSLQPEELTELVEGANVPATSLVDTQDLDGSQSLGNVASTERAGHILNSVRQDVDKVVITESTVFLTLQVGECALGRVTVQVCFILAQTDEKLWDGNLFCRLAHKLPVDLLGVLFVVGTDGGVPAVGQVELNRALVTHTLRGRALLLHMRTGVLCEVSSAPVR